MATSNSREVKLGIDVSTSGTDAVKALRDAVGQLAKSGGDAAPQFEILAQELDRVAQQQNAIDSFVNLKRAVIDLDGALLPVTQQVDKLGLELADSATKTELFQLAQKEAAASVLETSTLLTNAKNQLTALKVEYQNGRVSIQDYKVASGDLKATISTLGANLDQLNTGFKESRTQANAAAAEEKTLQSQYNQSVNSAVQLSNALGAKNAALAASRDTLNSVGLSTTSLVEAENKVRTAFTEATTAVNAHLVAEEKSAAAARALTEAQKLLDSEIQIETAGRRQAIAAEEQYLATIKASAIATRQAAADSAAALNQAFAVTGVKSANAVQAEIAQINAALDKLAGNSRVSGQAFDQAFTAGQAKIAALRREAEGLGPVVEKAGTSFGYLKQQLSQLTAIYGGIQLAQAFIDANVQAESLSRSLVAVTGSSDIAASQIAVLHDVANRAGVSVGSIADSFRRFNASAIAAGVPVGTVNELFSALTIAGAKAGLSSDRVSLSLDALAQIAGKGTVQMEELKGQLGDSLPGALKIASNSLGITIPQLTKLVEAGGLTSDVFLKAFGPALEEAFGKGDAAVTGFSASFGRFKNSLTDFATTIGEDAGAMTLFSGVLSVGNVAIESLTGVIRDCIGGVRFLGEAIGITAAAIATFDVSNPTKSLRLYREALSDAALKGADFITGADKLKAANAATADSTAKAAVGVKTVGEALATVAPASATAVAGVQALAAGQIQATTAATGHAAALVAASDSTRSIGVAAVGVSGQVGTLVEAFRQTRAGTADNVAAFAKLEQSLIANRGSLSAAEIATALLGASVSQTNVAYGNLIAATEKDEAVATKNADSKRTQGKALTDLIGLTGDQIRINNANIASVEGQLAAEQRLSDLNQRQVEIATAQKAAVLAQADAVTGLNQAQVNQIKTIDQGLAKYQAQAEKSVQQVAVLKAEVLQRQLVVETYGNQSASLGDLRKAYDLNVTALNSVIQAQQRGVATDADVLAQTAKLAASENKYRDALKDTIDQLGRRSAAAAADNSLTVAGLNNRIAASKVQEDYVRGLGDESAATSALIDQKRLQIEVVQANSKVQTDAANSTITALKLELSSNLDLTEAQKDDINTRLKIAEAAKLQAAGSEIVVNGINNEINALVRKSQQVAVSLSQSTDLRNATITQQSLDAKGRQDAINHTSQDNTGLQSLLAKQKAGTLSSSDLTTAQAVQSTSKANLESLQAAQKANPAAIDASAINSTNQAYNQATDIVNRLLSEQRLADRAKANPAPTAAAAAATVATTPAAATATPAASTSHTVTINLNGQSTTINAASASDAAALTNLLTSLQAAASRTS